MLLFCALLFFTQLDPSAELSNEANCGLFTILPDLCPSAEMPDVCSARNLLKQCSNNITRLSGESDNSSQVDNEVDAYCTSEEDSTQFLLVPSRQTFRLLSDKVLEFSTSIARAIAQLSKHFSWDRIAILADVSNRYFLLTAEEINRQVNLTSENFFQLRNKRSAIEDTLQAIENLRLKIIVVSLRPSITLNLLCMAHERNLVWPEYVWIVHSVDISAGCKGISLEGVVTVQINFMYTSLDQNDPLRELLSNTACLLTLNHCETPKSTIVFSQLINDILLPIFQFSSSKDSLMAVNKHSPFPSDLQPPLYSPTFLIVLYYVGNSISFALVTFSLVLYIYFRNEPVVKATSVSLSSMIYIGNYLLILHLFNLNSNLLPTLYKQDSRLHNCMCTLQACLNGLGIPLALIFSTLLVKMLRVYRIFSVQRKVSKFTSSDCALALYALLITAPNALICVLWVTIDPYSGTIDFSIENGFLVVTFLCVSNHAFVWTALLLVYFVTMTLLLIVMAILTRKIKYRNFKDTKKVAVLSFLLILTSVSAFFYWYLLRIIDADVTLIHTVLQVSSYCAILECQGFIFGPKLFPIIREKVLRKYYKAFSIPSSKPCTTTTTITA